MMMQRRNPLANVSLAPYGAQTGEMPPLAQYNQGVDVPAAPAYIPPPMNIEHAQFAQDDPNKGIGSAIGGIGAALLGRMNSPQKMANRTIGRMNRGPISTTDSRMATML